LHESTVFFQLEHSDENCESTHFFDESHQPQFVEVPIQFVQSGLLKQPDLDVIHNGHLSGLLPGGRGAGIHTSLPVFGSHQPQAGSSTQGCFDLRVEQSEQVEYLQLGHVCLSSPEADPFKHFKFDLQKPQPGVWMQRLHFWSRDGQKSQFAYDHRSHNWLLGPLSEPSIHIDFDSHHTHPGICVQVLHGRWNSQRQSALV